MADRAVVRQGPVVMVCAGPALVLALALTSIAADNDGTGTKPPEPPKAAAKPSSKGISLGPAKPSEAEAIEKKPYKIITWIVIDPRARVDAKGRESIISGWKVLANRFVGAPWEIKVAEGETPLATTTLEALTSDLVLPLAKGYDKAWIVVIEPDGAGGLTLAAREFDAATARVGLLCRRPATVVADAPRALLQLSLDIFAPVADIGQTFAREATLQVQGGMVPAANAIGQVVPYGAVFRPVVVYYKPDGGVLRIDVVPKTYLRVESVEGGRAKCSVTSALPNPFTKKIIGKSRYVALGLKPASIPTRLRFVSPAPEKRPISGYTLTARPAPDGTPRNVGTTDREGRIVLEPGWAEGLTILRLLAADFEPLAEFPVMPGEQVEENVLSAVDPKAETVRIESEIHALRDEIVDLIALRTRLLVRLKARAAAENWDEVKTLLDQFRLLPPRSIVEEHLKKLDAQLVAEQEKANQEKRGRKVRTGTAQKLVGDTTALIDGYLEDDEFRAYSDAYQQYLTQKKADSQVKALPKSAPMAFPGGAPATAGPVDFSPPGAGFRVMMPGSPTESTGKTADGASDIHSYRVEETGKGVFLMEYSDYPLALAAADIPQALDTVKERLGAQLANSRTVRERSITLDGREGKEVEWEAPGAAGLSQISRIVAVNSRLFSATWIGPKDQLKSTTTGAFLDSLHVTSAARPVAEAPPAAAPVTSSTAGAADSIQKAQKKAATPSPASRPANSAGGGTPF